MLTQTYRDITFVFGAPDGDRYEMLKETAHHKNLSFSAVYRTYMDEILLGLHGEGVFDHAFSGAVGPKLKVNKIFPTYQHWRGREERFEKFFVSPEEEYVEITAVMVFPPQFTDEQGVALETDVEFEHANFVSAIIGQSLRLDWVQVYGTFLGEERSG